MSILNKIIKRVIYKNEYSNDAYIKYLRKNGAKIGNGTYFYEPTGKPCDATSLPFIEIGENCRITSGVKILAHDYSYAVLRKDYHCMLRKSGITKIGNNVFIGWNSIIMMNVKIGNNVIIASGSIVTKDIPDNVVIGGNPARIICTLDDYYKKNEEKFEYYAAIYYKQKSAFLNKKLTENDMNWYNQLWKYENKKAVYNNLKVDGDNKEELINDILNYKEKYSSFEEFVNNVDNIIEKYDKSDNLNEAKNG